MGTATAQELIPVRLLNPVEDDTGIALYRQIADRLRELIEDFHPGAQLPSETQLSEYFSVSRATAIQAVRLLVDRGLVVRQRGRGTFVADRNQVLRRNAPGLTSFSDDLRRAGYATSERVVASTTRTVVDPFDPESSEQRASIGPCWALERVILADERPVALVRSFLPLRVAPPAPEELEPSSLYEYLRTTHPDEVPAGVTEYWEAMCAPTDVCRRLELSPGTAVMRVRRTAYNMADAVVEYSDSYVRSDVFRVRLVLGTRDTEGHGSRFLVG